MYQNEIITQFVGYGILDVPLQNPNEKARYICVSNTNDSQFVGAIINRPPCEAPTKLQIKASPWGEAVEYYETDEVKTLDNNNSIDNHKRFQPHPSPIGATFPNLGEGF